MKPADVNKYRKALDKISESAKKDLLDAYAQMSNWHIEQQREALGDVFSEICRRYGNLSGAVAAEFYDLIRGQSNAPAGYRATLAPNVPDVQAKGAYDYSARHFDSDTPEKVVASLNGRLQRFVENTARETVHVNASKDRARVFWARVPAGGKTCAWCYMLASRGWVYATEQTAGGVGNEFHNDDRCMIIPSFDDSPALAGYDPDAMYEKYQAARQQTEGELTDKNIAATMRDMFPDDFRDGNKVPSILRDASRGWPKGLPPVTPTTWGHVLDRHQATAKNVAERKRVLANGGRFRELFDGMTPYEIAVLVQEVASTGIKFPPEGPRGILNYHKIVDGREYAVGFKYRDGKAIEFNTSFPVREDRRRL